MVWCGDNGHQSVLRGACKRFRELLSPYPAIAPSSPSPQTLQGFRLGIIPKGFRLGIIPQELYRRIQIVNYTTDQQQIWEAISSDLNLFLTSFAAALIFPSVQGYCRQCEVLNFKSVHGENSAGTQHRFQIP